eukprot:s11336_g1.t1
MERFRDRGQHTVETFLRRISFEQLWCFLWWSSCWSTARSLLQKLQGAAPKGSDPLRLLLDEEAAEGTSKERGFTKEDRGSLRKCIEEELKDFSLHFAGSDFWCGVSLERYFPQEWCPSWWQFRQAAGQWLREPHSQDPGESETTEDPEQEHCVCTLGEWLSLLESLDTRGRLMNAVKLGSRVVEAGWVLRDEYIRDAEIPALPLWLTFDNEDAAGCKCCNPKRST